MFGAMEVPFQPVNPCLVEEICPFEISPVSFPNISKLLISGNVEKQSILGFWDPEMKLGNFLRNAVKNPNVLKKEKNSWGRKFSWQIVTCQGIFWM